MNRIAYWMGWTMGTWMYYAGLALDEVQQVAGLVMEHEAVALPQEYWDFEEIVPGYA